MTEKKIAIGMYSGGLDSILAARVMREQGFHVVCVHFYTGFNKNRLTEIQRGPDTPWVPEQGIVRGAEELGLELLPLDVSDEYITVMRNPQYGFGSAVNPCIDCRIFLLNKAREVMEERGAALVFTGEVVGQRPMSQMINTLRLVEKRSGLEGRLLRPLSALRLAPTIPETEGLVDRDLLYDFQGRARTPQQELAAEFGIDWFPSSGGGCMLTDKNFRKKFEDLTGNTDSVPSLFDLTTLKAGRHLRLPSGTKVIIGRDEPENNYLEALFKDSCWWMHARDSNGATVFVPGEPSEDDLAFAATLAARYSKASCDVTVPVSAFFGSESREFDAAPADNSVTKPLLIC